MGTGIKNGKLHTINKGNLKLTILIVIAIFISGISNALAFEKKWVIVIDAGHGGKDPGALGQTTREKNITLAVALKTGEYIEQNIENALVLYTRKNDVFVDIKERAEFANKNKADLFISIHANWAGGTNIRGTETFVMGPAKDQQNLEVAMKENEVILLEDDYSTKYEGFDPKSTESYIMFALMQNIFLDQSTGLASRIQSQFKERAGRIDRGVKQAGFWVLYMTTMPSVLVETGFITNPEEEKYLSSKEGQDYISSAIYRACRDYIKEVAKKSVISTSREEETLTDNPSIASSNEQDEKSALTFMVQIASSSSRKDLKPENFKGLRDISEYKSDDRYKYAAGSFQNYEEALDYRKKIKSKYSDAFVIAVKDNKILPLQEALELRKHK